MHFWVPEEASGMHAYMAADENSLVKASFGQGNTNQKNIYAMYINIPGCNRMNKKVHY